MLFYEWGGLGEDKCGESSQAFWIYDKFSSVSIGWRGLTFITPFILIGEVFMFQFLLLSFASDFLESQRRLPPHQF